MLIEYIVPEACVHPRFGTGGKSLRITDNVEVSGSPIQRGNAASPER